MLSLAKSLPPSMVRLCNRLAAEEIKVHTWELCRKLREEYAMRLAGGETIVKLEGDIQARVLQAAHKQLQMSMAPARARVEVNRAASCAPQQEQA